MTQQLDLGALPGDLREKIGRLEERLRILGRVVVAFSGGVDSALLASMSHRVLGDEAVAALADGPSLPARERENARELAESLGIRLHVIGTKEIEDPRYLANTGDRCYWCREAMVAALRPLAEELDASLVYGAVLDDLGEDRPGMRAAEEGGMLAPLLDAGFRKEDVRGLAKALGLSVWDKPAAACLSSRFMVGTPVSREGLAQVERAEDALLSLGFRVLRVRHHGDLARVEVGEGEISALLEEGTRQAVLEALRAAGYRYVTLDLGAYRPAGLLPVFDPPRRG